MNLFVAYAKPSGIVTTGGGYIDEFDTSGNFLSRVFTDTAATNLHGPWGMAIAPAGFGSFAGDLLVGSFGNATATSGNGTISVINNQATLPPPARWWARSPAPTERSATPVSGASSTRQRRLRWHHGHDVLHRRDRRPDPGPAGGHCIVTRCQRDGRRHSTSSR